MQLKKSQSSFLPNNIHDNTYLAQCGIETSRNSKEITPLGHIRTMNDYPNDRSFSGSFPLQCYALGLFKTTFLFLNPHQRGILVEPYILTMIWTNSIWMFWNWRIILWLVSIRHSKDDIVLRTYSVRRKKRQLVLDWLKI